MQLCIAFWILIPNKLANLFYCGSSQVISAIASDDCCAYLCQRGSRHCWRNMGFNSWPGGGWKKQKMTPYIWKAWCCLVPLTPTVLPSLPPTHALIKRVRISSYAVLGNRLESPQHCNQCVILLLGMSPMHCVQGWGTKASLPAGAEAKHPQLLVKVPLVLGKTAFLKAKWCYICKI